MKYVVSPLEWDTDYFQKKSAKVVLNEKLSNQEFAGMVKQLKCFEFVTITNVNNDYYNNFLIGQLSTSFLVDINMQFQQPVDIQAESPQYRIDNNFKPTKDIVEIASNAFNYSRFYNDPYLNRDAAKNIYANWVKNSFKKSNKYFVVAEEKELMGFLLFSIKDDCATIELISLSSKAQGKGAGTKLVSALNNFAHKKGVTSIKVGTQVDNIQAVNFYLKKGFTYNQRNAVYHYWPRKDFSYE